MAADKLNPNTPNREIGAFIVSSHRVTPGTKFGELATWIKVTTQGIVVWRNNLTETNGVWFSLGGETLPIACDEILISGIVDGITETTTATGLYWGSCAPKIG